MVIDFSTIGVVKEQPTLVLCNADGKSIQPLGYAYNLKANICYNEMSTITFNIPAYVDGVKTPHYDDIIGMRIINMLGWGKFILTNPSVANNGVSEIKSCKAYSLEYELTYKKVFFEEATYNLWDPLSPDDTVLGMILSDLPSWNVGTVDSDLIGKYRTFSVDDSNAYNFIKSTLQQTYSCIFDFDTYTRTINVRSTANKAVSKPVYLSMDNLLKEIEIDEDTENIFTVLDVNGGEDVNIRMVNPLGTNKIYNLDYFMNTSHFDQSLVDKWNSWKNTFETYQLSYYNISIERMLKTSAILTEKAALSELKNVKLASLKTERSVYVEHLAQLTDKTSDEYNRFRNKLADVNDRISDMNADITAQSKIISALEEDEEELKDKLLDIQKSVSFDKFFTSEELVILDRYFKEESIEESSFVVSEVDSYSDSDISNEISDIKVKFDNCSFTKVTVGSDKVMYTVDGGTLTLTSNATSLTAKTVNACFERNSDGSIVLSAFLNRGSIGNNSFPSGCISITGVGTNASTSGSSKLSFTITTGNMYFTRNTTDYEKHSVSWDLFKYGKETLNSLAFPSYTFKVESANFMTIEDFAGFVRQLELGQKIYLNTGSSVLQPIFIGAEIDFEDPSSLSLQFSDKYSSSDDSFKLVELLDQSISMGKTVDKNKMSYSAFVNSGASTKVKEFMDSALDVAKNTVLSSSGQGVAWDSSGLHLRKYIDANNPDAGFENEQVWMINNSIVFTDDGWQTAKMAIGKIIDENIAKYPETADTVFNKSKTYYYIDENKEYQIWGGNEDNWVGRPLLYEKDITAYGIVAPYIVGTILAGQNLVITTEDGSFRVDSSGVHIDSLKFYITHGNSGYDTTLGDELNGLTEKQDELSGTIQNVINEKGHLKASEISGVISTQTAQMSSSTGNVLFDSDGLWLLDETAKSESTKAIWMNETGILFGSGKRGAIDATSDEDGAWSWTTAIGHDGIVAEAIAAGTLSGMEIIGGSLKIGGSEKDGYALTVNEQGNATFNGTVQATDFLTPNGESMLNDGKFKSDYLSLYGLAVKNKDTNETTLAIDDKGNVTMNGTLSWNANNSPVKVQYSFDGKTNWHDTFSSTDYFAKYSYDGGNSWTNAVRFQGENGQNGESGSIDYDTISGILSDDYSIQSTTIDGKKVMTAEIHSAKLYSPDIYTNDIGIYPIDGDTGTFTFYGKYDDRTINTLTISYQAALTPQTTFQFNGNAVWNAAKTEFTGKLDFSKATEIKGLSSVAVFGE